MAFPSADQDPVDLARQAYLSEDRVDRGLADALLRGLTVKAQMRQAAALERIAAELEGGRPDRMSIFELIADRMPSQ